MKRKRFTEEQIIGILKEAKAGAKKQELCRKHGMITVCRKIPTQRSERGTNHDDAPCARTVSRYLDSAVSS